MHSGSLTDALAVQRAERQRLDADLATTRAIHAAEFRRGQGRLAATEQAARAANERAHQAAADVNHLNDELMEARDAIRARLLLPIGPLDGCLST